MLTMAELVAMVGDDRLPLDERMIRWLEDALDRNQIVHETDRAIAREFINQWERQRRTT